MQSTSDKVMPFFLSSVRMENKELVYGGDFIATTDRAKIVSFSRTNSNGSTGRPGHDFDNSTESLSPRVYGDLSSEQTARIAIVEAFKNSPAKFLTKYTVNRVIGFGSNGAVLAAISDISAEQLNPISFYVRYNSTTLRRVNLPFSSGSSDLWAWAYTHRAHAWELSQFQNTKLPIRQVKQIIQRVAMALAEVHTRGFYHGDIKLENILVEAVVPGCSSSKSPEIRLADFGHARRVASGIKRYGTQEMSPPELLRDSPYDAAKCDGRASDVFALGMMTYILVNDSGSLPKIAQAIKAGKIGYEELVAVDSGSYPMNGLEDIDVSGQELLDGMCMVDPKRRLTVEQIIAHSWFSEL
ncbi:hypothetical protein HK100_006673 [Physocladia obscura]|uniref:Protein kinase domain-containing protein n=1 Tax=Physocladia obscura TaxID=109957 RepID=A0AAD5X8P0_9FUNG|nr:hypothetical protein HK100_006673 [Physocladia obscura]